MLRKMTKKDLIELLEEYLQRITYLNDCYNLHKHMVEAKKEYLKEINIFPAFYSLALLSFLKITIIELAKLYDIHSKTSINALLNTCGKNFNLFLTEITSEVSYVETNKTETFVINVDIKKSLSEAKKNISSIKHLIEPLRNQRNKYYAHLDKEYQFNYNLLINTFPLSYNDIDKLISLLSNICNTLYYNLCNASYVTQSSNWNDIDNMLKIAKGYNSYEKKARETELNEYKKKGLLN